MARLGRLWAGRLYGTNTGNLAAELNSTEDGAIAGVVRFMDSALGGPIVYEVTGTYADGKLSFDGKPQKGMDGQEVGDGDHVARRLLSDGLLCAGLWAEICPPGHGRLRNMSPASSVPLLSSSTSLTPCRF